MKKRLYIDAWGEIPKKEAKRLQEVGEKGIFTFRLDSANIHTTVYRLAKHLELEQGSETSYYGLFIPPSNDEVIKLRLSDHKSSPSEWLKYELYLPNRRYSIVVFNSKSMHHQYSDNCEYIDWTSYDVEGINVHELCISCKYLIKYWSFLRQILSGIYNGENVEKYSIERYAISLKGYESSNDMAHDWNKTIDKITENKQDTNMKTENRNVVRLTESKLKQIIAEELKKVLKETGNPGSLIHGTHRREDLIPVFMSEIFRNNPQKAREIWKSSPNLLQALCDKQAGINTNWWDSEEAMYICDELQDALQEYAPEGHYFGTHMGDGSDFGYWNDEN